MMVLLSKREYDALVARAGSVEAQVDARLEVAKREILRKLHEGMKARRGYTSADPMQTLQDLVAELLR